MKIYVFNKEDEEKIELNKKTKNEIIIINNKIK